MQIWRRAGGVAILVLALTARADAEASLDTARQLYAAAEYENALAMLDGLRVTPHPDEEQRAIELYRILCLVAMGKDAESQSAIETMVMHNPLYRPTDELPPRIRATFDEARKRLIPAAVQGKYQESKAAFDFKDYVTAERSFGSLLELFDDAEVGALIKQTPLVDLRTLAEGFYELSKKANAPLAPAQPSTAAASDGQPLGKAAARAPKIYSVDDSGVVPPTTVDQRIPSFPGTVRSIQTGVIEVLIDRDGSVQSATMLEGVNPQYDRIAVNAARSWRYQPATVDGAPVMFLKRIQVNLVPGN